jgi:hypothetical protein
LVDALPEHKANEFNYKGAAFRIGLFRKNLAKGLNYLEATSENACRCATGHISVETTGHLSRARQEDRLSKGKSE